MSTNPSSLTERLRTEVDKTTTFFDALTDDQWQQIVYMEKSTWTAHDVLAHILFTEVEFLRLFKDIRAGGQGVADGFSIDDFNAMNVARLRPISASDLLKGFKQARQAMIEWVELLDPSELLRMGRHPFLGTISLGEMIKMVTLHEHIHVREVRHLIGVA